MWIINWLPETFIHIIFLMGMLGTIMGFALGFIPFVGKYKLPIQIISLLLLSLGIYLEGGLAEKQRWESKVKDMEVKIAKAEAAAAKVNIEIVEKVIKETQVIKEKGQKVIEYIDREVKVYDDKCTIPEVAILAHNMAAENKEPEVKNE